MNPAIPLSYAEVGRWLENFATSHARREHAGIVVRTEMEEAREGRSYALRLRLGDLVEPPPELPPLELDYTDAAAGRSRFAWCEALAERFRVGARALVAASRSARSA